MTNQKILSDHPPHDLNLNFKCFGVSFRILFSFFFKVFSLQLIEFNSPIKDRIFDRIKQQSQFSKNCYSDLVEEGQFSTLFHIYSDIINKYHLKIFEL